MKHIVILIALLVGASAFSQTLNLRSNETYGAKTWNESIDSADTYSVVLFTETPNEYKAYIKQSIDSVSTPNTTVYRDYKVFLDDAWTRVDTVSYKGTADTTFTYNISTATRYRYHRLTFVQTKGSAKVGRTQIKIHNQ